MKESQVVDALGALASEHRLRIFRHLVKAGALGRSAGEIGAAVGAAPSKVSFHMSTLEQAGLVSATRVSRKIIYRANFQSIGRVIDFLVRDCCQSNTDVMSCCGIMLRKR